MTSSSTEEVSKEGRVSFPGASWIDLAVGGFVARGWIGVAQSNWVRLVESLRATEPGGSRCPFVDLGFSMLSDRRARRNFCDVLDNPESKEPWHGLTVDGRGPMPDPPPAPPSPCIIVPRVAGGLGNQFFQAMNIVALSEEFGVPYSLPLQQASDTGNSLWNIVSPTYWNDAFKGFAEHSVPRERCADVGWSFDQWAKPGTFTQFSVPVANMSAAWQKNLSSAYAGNMMEFTRPLARWHTMRDIFVGASPVPARFRRTYPGRNVMIGFRSYQEEKQEQWAFQFAYYEWSIRTLLPANGTHNRTTLHVYGEAGGIEKFGDRITSFLASEYAPGNQARVVLHPGVREIVNTTRDLLEMTACDDFVICGSSFHPWGAFLSPSAYHGRGRVVRADHHWQKKGASNTPPFWVVAPMKGQKG